MPDAVSTPSGDARRMDGRPLAERLRQQTAAKVHRILDETGVVPTLATVLVGNDPASAAYVRTKRRRCEEVGIRSHSIELPSDTRSEQLVEHVQRLADDPAVHAILVQHPVPHPLDRRAAFETIPLHKDVDGVSSAALGRIILGMPAYASCTPLGILRLLCEDQVPLDGAHAAVLGRSPILGRPMASMLINAHATVTLCHSRTRDLQQIVRQADVLIVAVCRPRFVRGDWLKSGAVVVDAGYNPGPVGDVDYDSAARVASLLTPVPGGVGPMTIAMLLEHTADAAASQLGVSLDL